MEIQIDDMLISNEKGRFKVSKINHPNTGKTETQLKYFRDSEELPRPVTAHVIISGAALDIQVGCDGCITPTATDGVIEMML